MTANPTTTPVAAGFSWRSSPCGPILQQDNLLSVATHAFTTRHLQLRGPAADDEYGRLAAVFGVDVDALVKVNQVHGRRVVTLVPGENAPRGTEADAIVSLDSSRAIAVRVADCVPVLFADRQRRLVGAVHAGWRGTCTNVTGAAVQAAADAGVSPEDLIAVIGPSIGPCCYQVDDRVRTTFLGMTPDAARWFAEDGPGHWRLNLWEANQDQLEEAGVPAEQIFVLKSCTADNLQTWFSYRREGSGTGRLAAVIRLAG